MIAARHAHVSQDELREERQVETEKYHQRRKLGPPFGIHAAGHFGPPVVQSAHVGHDGAAHHDVVEVGHHEVGVGHVDVEAERREEQPRQSADGEQSDKAERVEHRRGKGDRPFI